METTKLDAGANKLLISIGGHVEKWILNNARSNVESISPGENVTATITADNVRVSFQAFLNHGIGDIAKAILGDNEAMQLASRRAG